MAGQPVPYSRRRSAMPGTILYLVVNPKTKAPYVREDSRVEIYRTRQEAEVRAKARASARGFPEAAQVAVLDWSKMVEAGCLREEPGA